MMNEHHFAPKLYYRLSLDQLVPQNHLLRQIQGTIDFSFIYPLAKPYYSYTGQPSVDPVIIFKTLLIGYLYGITSERRLMEDIQVNLAYRWFLGYDLDENIPDHSVLSKARVRFGKDIFERFFHHSIELCRQAGMLTEGPVFVDSTLVQANASLDSLVRKENKVQPPLSVPEYVERLYAENPVEEGSSDSGSTPSSTSTAKPERPVRFNMVLGDKKHHKTNREVVSRTDPEATVMHNQMFGLRLAYKAHVAVGGKQGKVITAAIATTGAKVDEHVLSDVLTQHRQTTRLPIREVVADAKYGTMDNYLSLDQAGMVALIPPHERHGEPRGIWGRSHFQYLPDQDCYLCPAGKVMKKIELNHRKGRFIYRVVERGSCWGCEHQAKCSRSGNDRKVSRFIRQELVEAAKERLTSPSGEAIYRQRKTLIEGIFAQGKQWHGLRRTPFRGKWKVQIHFWLIAAVLNIKRVIKEVGERGLLLPGPNQSSSQVPPANSSQFKAKAVLISFGWIMA